MRMQNPLTKLFRKREQATIGDWASLISDQFVSKFNSALMEVERFEDAVKKLSNELVGEYGKAMRAEVDAALTNFKQKIPSDFDTLSTEARRQINELIEVKRREVIAAVDSSFKVKLELLAEEAEKLTEQLEGAMSTAREAVSAIVAKSDAAIEAVKMAERKLGEIPIRPVICSCGRVNLPHAKFCDNCGLTLEQTRTLST